MGKKVNFLDFVKFLISKSFSMFEIDLKWVKFLSTLLTLKHFDGTGISVLLDSLQSHCAQRVDGLTTLKWRFRPLSACSLFTKGMRAMNLVITPLSQPSKGFPVGTWNHTSCALTTLWNLLGIAICLRKKSLKML